MENHIAFSAEAAVTILAAKGGGRLTIGTREFGETLLEFRELESDWANNQSLIWDIFGIKRNFAIASIMPAIVMHVISLKHQNVWKSIC